eukprot:3505981-Rhodomonas_salina.1
MWSLLRWRSSRACFILLSSLLAPASSVAIFSTAAAFSSTSSAACESCAFRLSADTCPRTPRHSSSSSSSSASASSRRQTQRGGGGREAGEGPRGWRPWTRKSGGCGRAPWPS